jgi:transporter family-2 protein
VTCALITVKSIGAGGVAAGTITGQLIASVAIDRIGAFGLNEEPLTLSRIAGVLLLLLGTWLIVR